MLRWDGREKARGKVLSAITMYSIMSVWVIQGWAKGEHYTRALLFQVSRLCPFLDPISGLMDCILRSEFCLSGTHTLSDSCPTLSLPKGSLTPFMFTPEPQSRTLVHSSCLELCPLQYLHPMSPLRIDMHSYPTSYQVDGTPSEFPIFVWKFPTLVQMVHMLLWKSFRCSIKVVCLRCRDSSLYGHIQTVSQDLILDLLQCSDFRDFHTFAHLTYFMHFALCIVMHFTFQIPCVFTHLTYCTHFTIPHSSHFAHSHISCILHFHIFCILHFCILAFFALSCMVCIPYHDIYDKEYRRRWLGKYTGIYFSLS